jgi:hypothetical protein
MKKLLLLSLLLPFLFACDKDNSNEPDIPAGFNVLNYDAANFDAPLLPPQTYISAVRFSPTRLAPYIGKDMVSVFYWFSELPQSAEIHVYTSNGGLAPTSLIFSAPLSNFAGFSWNSFQFPTPINITGTEDLWIGIKYTRISEQRILGWDPCPAVLDGDWHWDGADSTWTPLVDRTNGQLDINWNIRAVIDPS